jgi:hypothetical protein
MFNLREAWINKFWLDPNQRHARALFESRQHCHERFKMSDKELIEELSEHARHLEEPDGQVNPFLAHEHELLTNAVKRLSQLTAYPAPPH